jgi:hypothetical protein
VAKQALQQLQKERGRLVLRQQREERLAPALRRRLGGRMRQASQYLPEERARLALRRSVLKEARLMASQELVVQPQQQRPAL